jgi:hypothetical protein
MLICDPGPPEEGVNEVMVGGGKKVNPIKLALPLAVIT